MVRRQHGGVTLGVTLVLIFVALVCNGGTFVGTVTRVVDGDTITLKIPHQREDHVTVRLANIDAPERAQRFGQESTHYLASLILNKTVRVEYSKADFFGRIIGTVYLMSGDSGSLCHINRILLAEGYAWHYRKYSSSAELADVEMQARARRKGLWKEARPVPPWNHRATLRKQRSQSR